MYIYVKVDKRSVVKDYERKDYDPNAEIKEWPMKFYDFTTTNPDLKEEDGWQKVYLINTWYQSFEDYFDLFTIDQAGTLTPPMNIPKPSNDAIQALLVAQTADNKNLSETNQDLKADNETLKAQNAEIISKLTQLLSKDSDSNG